MARFPAHTKTQQGSKPSDLVSALSIPLRLILTTYFSMAFETNRQEKRKVVAHAGEVIYYSHFRG